MNTLEQIKNVCNCSNNAAVRCAVGMATKSYGYIDDSSVIPKKFLAPYTIEHLCACADLLDEIHNAMVCN